MCNRIVQKGREVKPGQPVMVLMRGPRGEFEMPFEEAAFGGPARNESRNYWIQREGADPLSVPDAERFFERDETTGKQNSEDVPSGTALEGLWQRKAPGQDCRALKVCTSLPS